MKESLKGICWLHMGGWPYYVGVCCHQKFFDRKMAALGLDSGPEFVESGAHAMTHYGRSHKGDRFAIITIPPPHKADATMESYASMVAHEAVHVVQHLKEEVSPNCDLGRETEAYLVQYIVMEALAFLYDTGMTKVHSPS